MTRRWKIGFVLHLALVAMISIAAYRGLLPTRLPGFPGADLLGHAVLIGLLAFFLDGALGFRPLLAGLSFPRLAPVAVLVVAAIEEAAQRFSPRRESSLSDYAADVVGVCVASWLARRIAAAPRRART